MIFIGGYVQITRLCPNVQESLLSQRGEQKIAFPFKSYTFGDCIKHCHVYVVWCRYNRGNIIQNSPHNRYPTYSSPWSRTIYGVAQFCEFKPWFMFCLSPCYPVCNIVVYIDDLVQDCSISNANALEILQSYTKPSISYSVIIASDCICTLYVSNMDIPILSKYVERKPSVTLSSHGNLHTSQNISGLFIRTNRQVHQA